MIAKNLIRIIHAATAWLICGLFVALFPLVALLATKVFKKNEIEFYHFGAVLWAKTLFSLGGLRIKVEGMENLPSTRPLLFASNHQSYVDVPLLIYCLPFRFRYAAWDTLFKIPFLGINMKKLGFVPISENNTLEAFKAIKKINSLLREGESIVVFPEGRVTKDGKLNPFGLGTSIISLNTKIPVTPIAINGTFNILPKGKWIFSREIIKVRIGKPVLFESYDRPNHEQYLRVTEKIRNSIEDLLNKCTR
jgi:1-acyl-sn-glycerol-3-phosphate acyltransferase